METNNRIKEDGQLQLVSIVIPTFNRRVKLRRLIRTIYESDYPSDKIEIIVVNNEFGDKAIETIKEEFPQIIMHNSLCNLFSGGSRDLGQKISKGEYIFFVDDDNVLHPKCISGLVERMSKNMNIGICAPLMLFFDDKKVIWSAGGVLYSWGGVAMLHHNENIDKISLPDEIYGADFFPNAYMVRREVFNKEIFHDSKNFPHNWSESDFSLRVKEAGYLLCTVTKSILWHDLEYRSMITRISSFNVYDQAKSRILFRKKHEKNIFRKLYFFIFYFPLTSFIYFCYFLKQKDRKKLIFSHFRGYLDGIKK